MSAEFYGSDILFMVLLHASLRTLGRKANGCTDKMSVVFRINLFHFCEFHRTKNVIIVPIPI